MLGALLVGFIRTPQASPSIQTPHNVQWHMQSMHSSGCILLVGIISSILLQQASSTKGQNNTLMPSGNYAWQTICRPNLNTAISILHSSSTS
jgi:hypothetical protein